MDKKPEEPTVYAFIDGQNLNLGIEKDDIDRATGKIIAKGWKLDYRKFRLYLKNKYGVTKAYYFIGQVPGNEMLYNSLTRMGYSLVFKPTMPFDNNGTRDTKGNVDAELVLYASALTYKQYDKAIIVSGDGDFLCLVEYLHHMDKLSMILAPNARFSSLLRKYAHKIVTLSKFKDKLEYTPKNKSD